ncbi:Serine carboxypeptidase-like 18 [Platanthera zijinensis]|uniref:Serine carboxypeptidase-like 18 n=1 Tax=Platanthera zijinensis TaxID=2320716 RepID=A0AAP0FY55_9ASPA
MAMELSGIMSWSRLLGGMKYYHYCMSLMMMIFYCTYISSAAKVTHLPAFDGPLPFHLETGYVTMGESEYFYYFVESERNPSEDPLLLWLVGGPYCSGFVGMALTIGPIKFKGDSFNDTSLTVVCNPHSWTKISNIIFLDWPVGSGFSFSPNIESYISDDVRSSKEIYNFLKQWLLLNPKFLSNPVYIGGDSYGGKLVPLVTHEIVQGNELGQSQPAAALLINLKGYLVGNGVTDLKYDLNARVPRAHGFGIISDELFEGIAESCKGNDYAKNLSADCSANMTIFNETISEINIQNVLAPICTWSMKSKRGRSMMEEKLIEAECSEDMTKLMTKWSNNPVVQKSLHIKEGTLEEWRFCGKDLNEKYGYNIESAVPFHFYLATKGYRALLYSGDHDLKIPFTGTLQWIGSLNFPVIQGWRSWHTAGQVAGYTILFSNNFTFATILGGNHMPANNRPLPSFSMFERWMSHELL